MESDLLKKENEFHKENEKLEQRTKELLQQVNDVMKIQDNLIKDSLRTKSELDLVKQTHFKPNAKVTESLKLPDLVDTNKSDDTDIPNVIDAMGVKNANHFYRTKIKSLQVENVRLQIELKKKTDEVKKIQKENQNIMEEKEKWFTAYNTTKSAAAKLESKISALNLKYQAKDSELTSTRKDLEHLKKELKNASLNSSNYEIRLNRLTEENEKLRLSLKNAKDEEKEMKENSRKQINDLSATIKQIEKHKMELLNGFKKQMLLIDNLKKQKVCLESLKMADIADSDYLKILDWKLEP